MKKSRMIFLPTSELTTESGQAKKNPIIGVRQK